VKKAFAKKVGTTSGKIVLIQPNHLNVKKSGIIVTWPGSIIVLASEIQTTKIKSLIDMLDKEAPQGSERVRVYYLENASAEELVKVLQEMPKKKTTAKKGKQQAKKKGVVQC